MPGDRPPDDDHEAPGAGAPPPRKRNWQPVLVRVGVSFIVVFQLTVAAAVLWVISTAFSAQQ
jgi:hypothetical protein